MDGQHRSSNKWAQASIAKIDGQARQVPFFPVGYQRPYAMTGFVHSLEAMEVILSGAAIRAFQASQQALTSPV